MPLKTIKMRKQQENRTCFLSRIVRYIQFEQKQKEVKIITVTLALLCINMASEIPRRASPYSDFQEKSTFRRP